MYEQNENIKSWLIALSTLRMFEGSLIQFVEHDYKETSIKIDKNSKFMCHTTSDGSIEFKIISEDMLTQKNSDIEEGNYYFYTTNLSHNVLGKLSAEKAVTRTIRRFIEIFGYIKMDVHIIQQEFKSSGEIKITIIIVDSELRNT